MGQNRYDRSYDNDRAPEPEKTFKTRVRYAWIRVKETGEDVAAFFGRAKKNARERAERHREAREKRRERREARAALRRERRAAEEPAERDTTFSYHGKDDFTRGNHITGDGTVTGGAFGTESGARFRLTKRFGVWLLLVVVAFAFTQGLQAKVSNIFFTFVVFLPVALFFYTLTAVFALRMHMASEDATVTKREPYVYEMRLINRSIFAYPFVEAVMLLPQSNSVRCAKRSVSLSMAPLGTYELKSEVRFRFRGSYAIGVECFYVYDFFRIMRFRVDVRSGVTVRVLPRRLALEGEEGRANSDEPDLTNRRAPASERVEIGDVRNYLPGDPLKLIHWNLTSRLEEPVVKDYNGGSTNLTYVYCDLAARYPSEPPEEPSGTPEEERRLRRAAREKRDAEKRKARAIAYAEKHGDALREEDLSALDKTASERRSEAREQRKAERAEKERARIRALQKKNPERARLLEGKRRDAERKRLDRAEAAPSSSKREERCTENVHLLADPAFYEDMNEYCADGVIDLALASALRELRRGNEVVLVWQDERSASGFCAYAFRSAGELSAVYPLFATAPLCRKVTPLFGLSAYAEDVSGVKQIFVTAMIDERTVGDFCEGRSVGGDGGELLLYSPSERFLAPARRRAYLEDCREALEKRGFTLILRESDEGGEGRWQS